MAAAPAIAAPESKVLGVGTYGCVLGPRLPCDDEVVVPADRADLEVGKLFYYDSDALDEWEQAERVSTEIDPAHAFTPAALRLCRVDRNAIPASVRNGCQRGQTLVPSSPYQLVMSEAGVPWDEAGVFPIATWLAMLETVLGGLQSMHNQALLHMDVKPANLLVQAATGKASIIDFSLATPEDAVFDAGYRREHSEYYLWPPEFVMLASIRQQQYERHYQIPVRRRGVVGTRLDPPTYTAYVDSVPDMDLRQATLDDLDDYSIAQLDRDRIVRDGVLRFEKGFPSLGAWATAMATAELSAELQFWIDEQRLHGSNASATISRYARTFDSYGLAVSLEWLMNHGHITFDAITTASAFRTAVFRRARDPSARRRATAAQLLAAVRQLRADRAAAAAVAAAAAEAERLRRLADAERAAAEERRRRQQGAGAGGGPQRRGSGRFFFSGSGALLAAAPGALFAPASAVARPPQFAADLAVRRRRISQPPARTLASGAAASAAPQAQAAEAARRAQRSEQVRRRRRSSPGRDASGVSASGVPVASDVPVPAVVPPDLFALPVALQIVDLTGPSPPLAVRAPAGAAGAAVVRSDAELMPPPPPAIIRRQGGVGPRRLFAAPPPPSAVIDLSLSP